MKRRFIIILILLAGTVTAQQLALQDPAEGSGEEPAVTEEAAGKTGQQPVGEEGDVDPADEAGPAGDEAPPAAAGASDDTTENGEDPDIPEVDESELTTEIEDDFEPTEEISEDYPVPLPSDI